MKQNYIKEWQVFRKDYAKSLLWILFICLFVSLYYYFSLVQSPEIARTLLEQLSLGMDEKADFFGIDIKKQVSDLSLFLFILANNLFASFLILIVGIIPVVIFPPLFALSTFLSVSILLANIELQGGSALQAFLLGILPHGVIEITALLYTTTIGVFLSRSIFKKLFTKKRDQITLKGAFLQSIRSFAMVSIPLIVLAAIVEGFITPLFIR